MSIQIVTEYIVYFVIISSTLFILYEFRYIKHTDALNYYKAIIITFLSLVIIGRFLIGEIYIVGKPVIPRYIEVGIRIIICFLPVISVGKIINETRDRHNGRGLVIYKNKENGNGYPIITEWRILKQVQLFGVVFLISEILLPTIWSSEIFWEKTYSFLITLVITVSATFIPLGLALISLLGNKLENNKYGIPYMEFFLFNREKNTTNIELIITTFLSVPIQLLAAGLSLYNYVIATAIVGISAISALVIGCFYRIASIDRKESYKKYLLFSLKELFDRAHYIEEVKKDKGQEELKYCVRLINRYVASCQKYTANCIKGGLDDFDYRDDCCILQKDILEMVNLSYCNDSIYIQIVKNYMKGLETIITACLTMNRHSEVGAILRYQESMLSFYAPYKNIELNTYYKLASEDHFTNKIIYGLCDFLTRYEDSPAFYYLIYLIQTVAPRIIFNLYIGILVKNKGLITENQFIAYRNSLVGPFLFTIHSYQIIYRSKIDDIDKIQKNVVYSEIRTIYECLQEDVYKWVGLDENLTQFWEFDIKLKDTKAIEECKKRVALFVSIVIEELGKIVNGWSPEMEKRGTVDFQAFEFDEIRKQLSLNIMMDKENPKKKNAEK